jgi:hypothetical protein
VVESRKATYQTAPSAMAVGFTVFASDAKVMLRWRSSEVKREEQLIVLVKTR